ncbi:hypothetical protein [Fimbriiglobus ruber]|uniref:hypothetical protein n=1 Tax=Fimbriiglobus ruber TaxID=1908690 RepID=UPI001EE6D47B|nr:hypothetical protein [Fimbriiglobus ruber]
MRLLQRSQTWVIYQSTLRGQIIGTKSVCEQSEWEEMERSHPGVNRLVQAGITYEGEAERLARGTSGDPKLRGLIIDRLTLADLGKS